MEELGKIGRFMNLKPHRYEWDPRINNLPIYLSLFTQVHESNDQEYTDLANYMQMNGDFKYLYIDNVSKALPMDIDIDSEDSSSTMNRLRYEFVKAYTKPLNSDSFLGNNLSHDPSDDDVEVAEAGQILREEHLRVLLDKLESLEFLPIDNFSISEIFHSHGINMRLLGLAASKTNYPHLMNLFCSEMAARSCKKVYRFHTIELIFQQGIAVEEEEVKANDRLSFSKSVSDIFGQGISSHPPNFVETLIDFLNLIFGSGKETTAFWKDILIPQIEHDFNFKINLNNICLGYVYHSFCQQINVRVKVEDKVKLLGEIGRAHV